MDTPLLFGLAVLVAVALARRSRWRGAMTTRPRSNLTLSGPRAAVARIRWNDERSLMTVRDGRAEQQRLTEARARGVAWRKWWPYLSERQWGTVRGDYGDSGNAWDYFSHERARSRAYRWGEDGLAGISDDGQRLCFALALWNGKDAILKERLFGLLGQNRNREGIC